MTALVLEWRCVDAVRVGWVPQPAGPVIPAAIIGPPGVGGSGGGSSEPAIIAGTTAQYWRGDKSWQTLDKTVVGLGNVDNTSDANKPVSTAQAAAIAGRQPLATVLTNTTASFTAGQETKLAGIASGATANDTDANLKTRGNHTGTQAVGTITGNWPVAQLNGGTGASSTTFWRGDGTWATPSGGGGAGSDPASYAANPTTPSTGSVSLGERTLANRDFVAGTSALWPEEQMQGRLDRVARSSWRAFGSGSGITSECLSGPTDVGTKTNRNATTTNLATRSKRIGWVSAATAGSLCGGYCNTTYFTIGNGAGLGGFYSVFRFVPSDAASVGGARMFVGFENNSAAPTNVDPAGMVRCVGVAALAGSANLNIVFGGTTAQTPIDLGSDYPANTLTADVYELILFAPPGTQNVHWQVTRNPGGPSNVFTTSGTLTNTTPGTTLPSNATYLAPRMWRSNNATALAVGIDLLWVSIETLN